MKLQLIIALFCLSLAPWVVSCGAPGSSTAGSITPNDSLPSGTIVTQANLLGVNGKTASGSAIVYRQNTTTFVLRLSSISVESAAGLRIVVTADSVALSGIELRAITGTQNYTLSFATAPVLFNSVSIRVGTAGLDYAQALF